MKHVPDGDLMRAIAKGDNRAFRELFGRHAGLVLGYGQRILRERGRAEDVSQETWLRVVRAAPRYEDQGQFRAWLLRIVRNLALNSLRHDRVLNFDETQTAEDRTFTKADFDSLFDQQEKVEKIKHLIEALPEAQRVALVMWLNEDLTYEELAKALGVSLTAVKSLLFRARRTIERGLKESP